MGLIGTKLTRIIINDLSSKLFQRYRDQSNDIKHRLIQTALRKSMERVSLLRTMFYHRLRLLSLFLFSWLEPYVELSLSL